MIMMSNNWRQVWNHKCLDEDPSLSTLLEMVGWKSETGALPVEIWLDFVALVTKKVRLRPGENVLEVGCGPGGFLLPIYQQGYAVSGIDYSENLLVICHEVMPNGVFVVAEAKSIPFEDHAFDIITSTSVFNYFDDHDYAESVVREISRCLRKGGRGAILDLNDNAKRDEFMGQRYARFGGREDYEHQYRNLSQLFFDRQWIIDLGQEYGLSGYDEEQRIDGYRNNAFRFNYFFEKAK